MTENRVDTLINSLLKRYPKGFDLSLDRISRLLENLGNPHLKLPPIIHIAGTNGKGSAAAACRALLESAGYSVHVHTSPHLVHWNERYRLGQQGGGKFVNDDTLADAIERVTKANRNQPITVFELLTAVAFLLFSEHPADAVILEVGLGGRFDATNVIKKPAVSLIMPISLDHVALLGNTVEKIAFEKGGIIKEGAPLVIGKQESEGAIDVLTSIAQKRHAPFVVYGQDFQAYNDHGQMVFQNETGLKELPLPSLRGDHQISNAASAIEALTMVAGMINTKDSFHYFKELEGLVDKVYTVPVLSSDSGVAPQELAKVVGSAGLKAEATTSIEDAFQKISALAPQRTILVAGSLYMAGDFLKKNGTPPE